MNTYKWHHFVFIYIDFYQREPWELHYPNRIDCHTSEGSLQPSRSWCLFFREGFCFSHLTISEINLEGHNWKFTIGMWITIKNRTFSRTTTWPLWTSNVGLDYVVFHTNNFAFFFRPNCPRFLRTSCNFLEMLQKCRLCCRHLLCLRGRFMKCHLIFLWRSFS